MRLFFLFTLLFLLNIFPPATAKADTAPDCVWWRMIKQERARDDGISISYELVAPEGIRLLDDVEVVFLSHRRSRTGNVEPPAAFSKKIVENEGAYTLDVYSGRYERIELLARVRVDDRWQYAKTIANGYGNSGIDDPAAERLAAAPDWPALHIVGEAYFYRPQTGQPVKLENTQNAASVEVFEKGGFVGVLAGGQDGNYSYTPPHDEHLSKQGYSAKNDLVFVAEMKKTGEKLSLYIPVYRSYYGKIDLPAGLGVFAACGLLALAAVLCFGRRFRWR